MSGTDLAHAVTRFASQGARSGVTLASQTRPVHAIPRLQSVKRRPFRTSTAPKSPLASGGLDVAFPTALLSSTLLRSGPWRPKTPLLGRVGIGALESARARVKRRVVQACA
eukprot:805341-Rhodomonas_salina.4